MVKIPEMKETNIVGRWWSGLVTKEDPLHLHKTLGTVCLLSYLWRFYQAGEADMGFATRPELTLPTILLHVSLNLSAFYFAIPSKRIKTGDRIWPEYRLHVSKERIYSFS